MHPKYHNHLLKCQFIDDCVAGTSAIKHGQSDFDYLPMYPSECDGVSVGQQYYALRKRMSHYEPVILRLINECVGMMCMNEPVIGFGVNDDTESAEEVRDIRYNGTLQKDGLSGLKVRTCRFVLQHGRYLLLLDSVGESGTNRAEFRVLEYKAASILDGEMFSTMRKKSGKRCFAGVSPASMRPVIITRRYWKERRSRLNKNGRSSTCSRRLKKSPFGRLFAAIT